MNPKRGSVHAEDANQLRRVIGRLARQFNASATDEGLTPSQASVLTVIVSRGPITLSDLARAEGINPTMLSRLVGKLEEAGLINRVPDPNDLRSALASGTAKGRQTHQRIQDQRARMLASRLDQLAPDQVGDLMQALPALEALSQEFNRVT